MMVRTKLLKQKFSAHHQHVHVLNRFSPHGEKPAEEKLYYLRLCTSEARDSSDHS